MQAAQPTIRGLQVVEHFGDVQDVIARLTAQPLVDQRARSAMRVKLQTLAARIEAERREFPELAIELQLAEAAEALAAALKQPDSDGARAVDFAHRALAAASFRF